MSPVPRGVTAESRMALVISGMVTPRKIKLAMLAILCFAAMC
jgi:hypothetical protein